MSEYRLRKVEVLEGRAPCEECRRPARRRRITCEAYEGKVVRVVVCFLCPLCVALRVERSNRNERELGREPRSQWEGAFAEWEPPALATDRATEGGAAQTFLLRGEVEL